MEFNGIEHEVTLTNQGIIEFGYLVMEALRPLIEDNTKLYFEEANCYAACFNMVCRMLNEVDAEYLDQHYGVPVFFFNRKKLSNDFDRLSFEDPVECQEPGFQEMDVPF